MSEVMSVPKLRFKEFDGDWSNKKIGNIASKVGSGSTPRGGAEAYTDHGIIFIRSQNVNNDQLLLDDVAYIPEETHVKMSGSKVIANDILLNITGASIGRSCVVPHDFTEANVNQHVCIIRTPNDDPIFVQSFLSSENGQNAIQSKQAGGGREGLNFQAIRSIDFHFPPSKEEQTEIASFLSNVDEKISQLTQKHELLSQYKQGMMQKLFSQQIRFKADDGSEFGEWEEVKFSDIFNFHQTNSYSRALLAEHGEIMNIHYGDIHTKFSMLFDVTKEPVPFLNDEVDTSKITNEQFLKVGDLVIADASEDYKDIGKAIEVISLNNQKVVAGLHTYIARPVKPFALGFCGYMMQTFPVREQIKKLATGISVLGISKTNLGKLELKVPFLEEQTKIANFLSAIDQKIEVVAQQIEQAKQWKKGLLQQMFV
jgi:type I restriction enzyme S subunit